MTRKEAAEDNFMQGYNCAQAVVLAFADILPVDADTLMRLSSSFGGGMGRLREVCGAVSGMFIVAGILRGYSGPETAAVKSGHYARIQKLAGEFEQKYGSIVCRELLGLNVKHDTPEASPRTPDFYTSRPCLAIIGDAAAILEKLLSEEVNEQ